MTFDHIVDTIFRAGVFRAMHGVSPMMAAGIACAAVVVAFALRRR